MAKKKETNFKKYIKRFWIIVLGGFTSILLVFLFASWGIFGELPTFEELENLPGVGHKTASVVMSQGFGYPAFAVDTHIHRLAQRWGLTNGKNVTQTEKDLKRIFPKRTWSKLHLQIIFYGREYCKARDCYGLTCKICTTCYPNRKKPVITQKA